MQKRLLYILTVLTSFYYLNSSCSKLDVTDIGADLLPVVDNVNTFETTLNINTTQGIFTDTTTIISNVDDHVLGKINNDPLFGTTTANIYAQFKPAFYPYYYGNANDSIIGFDSVVLCLSYKGFWGDSLTPLKLDVKQVPKNVGGLWDSVFQFRHVSYTPNSTLISANPVIGSTTVDFTKVRNWVVYRNKKDSMRNHIRIKLSLNADWDSATISKNAFRSDSLFKHFQNGLAILATGSGNGLMYTNLNDTSSRLEVHYRKKKSDGTRDTTFSSLRMIASSSTTNSYSITANNIIRNRTGAEISTFPANAIYLQTSPGTFANLKIPQLDTLSNRIVHRAEVIIEQVPNNVFLDTAFSSPDFLYLDLVDSATPPKWKPIYYDLNPSANYDPDFKSGAPYFPGSSGIDYFYHGGYARTKTILGQQVIFYNFNITRYVQEIVTKRTKNYTLRLSAPYEFSYPQYFGSYFSGNNSIANGRVKVGSGTNANYRMRLRIVYSKIKN